MRRSRVEWANAAAQDLAEIVTFIAHDSPRAAGRTLARLKARASALASFPARGRLVPELVRFGVTTYRELQVGPYRILYRISGKRVFVLGVFDGRRDLEEVLLQRLLRP